jgi:hypothetical protein
MIIYTESVNVFQHQQFCYFDLLQNTWTFFYCLMIVSDYMNDKRMKNNLQIPYKPDCGPT